MRRKSKKFFAMYNQGLSYLISLLVAIFISIVIITSTYYIHEGGHILFGYLGNIQNNQESSYNITNWIEHPIIPSIKVPQRTAILEGYNTVGFVIGGMFLDIMVFSVIATIIYKRSKNSRKKFILLIPLAIILFELTGNFLCGTDNLTGNPLIDCNASGISGIATNLALLLVILSSTVFLQPRIHSLLLKVEANAAKRAKRNSVTKLPILVFPFPRLLLCSLQGC